MKASLLLGCLTLLACADAVPVGHLPGPQAQHAQQVLSRLNLTVHRTAVGAHDRLFAPAADAEAARAVIAQLLTPPPAVDSAPRLITSPTEARLRAAQREVRAQHATINALPGVVGVQLSGPANGRRAIVQVLPDTPLTAAEIETLLGPGAQVRLVTLIVPAAVSVPDHQPSGVLMGAMGMLMLMVIGLLIQVRRLRKALGP